MPFHITGLLAMGFPKRQMALRKQHKLTQQGLADRLNVHLSQIRRNELGETQPTLDVIRQLAIALSVIADVLIFNEKEREPDDNLMLQFGSASQFTLEEKDVTKAVLESLIPKHDANRFSASG